MEESTTEITVLLGALRGGDSNARDKLVPLLYPELRRLAAYYMRREEPGHTLQATALVHEAYLRLVANPSDSWQNRAHFFATAAQVMRRILVDQARARKAEKRGGEMQPLALDEALASAGEKAPDLVALDDALSTLTKINPRQSRVVELRFFAGLSVEEIAEVLGVSEVTVKRDWSVARAWLHREIRRGE